MLIVTVVAPVFATNCYLLAASEGGPCLVVDPGAGVVDAVEAALSRHRLVPVALAATHGHVDHTWDAAELGERWRIPLYLHEADTYRLADPFGTLGGGAVADALVQLGLAPEKYWQPEAVVPVATAPTGATRLDLAGVPAQWIHAPGHTEGSSLLSLPGGPGPPSSLVLGEGWTDELDPTRTVLTGDVLFAGTVGRTDLPGGDAATMARTLADPVGMLAPDVLVLPGHGPATRMDVEYRRNPFLVGPEIL